MINVIPTYSSQAGRFLNKLTDKQVSRIKTAINKLPAGDVKKLKGYENIYRLRVGDVRVLFEKTNDGVYIIDINNRGDVYK